MKHGQILLRSLVPLFCCQMEKQMRHLYVPLHTFTVEEHVTQKVLGFRIAGVGGWGQPLIGGSGGRLLCGPASFEVISRRIYGRDNQRQASHDGKPAKSQ